MSIYHVFVIESAILLSIMLTMFGLILKSTSIHLFWKLSLPSLMAILICITPFSVAWLLGFPVETLEEYLPDNIQLLAYAPNSDETLVDLWVVAPNQIQPRSYEIPLTKSLKKTLREAGKLLSQGMPVILSKGNGHQAGSSPSSQQDGVDDNGQNVTNYEDDQTRFHINKKFDEPLKGPGD